MDIAEKVLRAKQDYDDVYEAGKKAEYDAFWDVFQYGGKAMRYIWRFSYNNFTDKTYNPKYPIVCSDGANAGQNIFYSSSVTDTKVPIYANSDLGGCFYWWRKGVTINKLVVQESTTYKLTFVDCNALKNITIEGVIGQNFDIGDSPLTTESIVSIMEHLSDTASGKTLTLNTDAVDNMIFPHTSAQSGATYNSWDELVASKSNWTISKRSA